MNPRINRRRRSVGQSKFSSKTKGRFSKISCHYFQTRSIPCFVRYFQKLRGLLTICRLAIRHFHVKVGEMTYRRTGQAVYVLRNGEARSGNHCCSREAISVTYYECVFVALCIQCEKSERHIVICGPSSFTICFHIIS